MTRISSRCVLKVVVAIVLLSVTLPVRVVAQGALLRFTPPVSTSLILVEPSEANLSGANADLVELRPVLTKRADYRWEFGIAGAALLGLAGAVAASAACNPDTASGSCVGPVVGTGAVGALVGGVIGLFVGAGVERRSD